MDLGRERPHVLVVDDEQVIREILSDFLSTEGFIVRAEDNGEAALRELRRRHYDMVISDLKMPGLGGIELLEKINELNLNVISVIMTGFGTVETAIAAMKKGAYDYILKPFKVAEVVHVVRRGIERQRLQLENIRLKEALSLYRVSEAMSQSLSLPHVMELVTQTTREELHADLVTLVLRDDEAEGRFIERSRDGLEGSESSTGELNFDEVLRHHRQDLPLIAHDSKIQPLFHRCPESPRLLAFCSVPLRIRHDVIGMINAYSFNRDHMFTEGQRKMLSILAGRAATSIDNARLYEGLVRSSQDLEAAKQRLEENFRQTIVGFANALEESDGYTRGHSERVALYSGQIARAMGFDAEMIETIILAAQVHDIGKIGIPTEKLNKPGPLSSEERVLLRMHPEKGKRILEPVPFLRKLVPGAYCHHERYDGRGYPQGIAGEEIPLMGRIIAVADAYDAMTSTRPYRNALSPEAAIREIRRCAGTQFDPNIAKLFAEFLDQERRKKTDFGSRPFLVQSA